MGVTCHLQHIIMTRRSLLYKKKHDLHPANYTREMRVEYSTDTSLRPSVTQPQDGIHRSEG